MAVKKTESEKAKAAPKTKAAGVGKSSGGAASAAAPRPKSAAAKTASKPLASAQKAAGAKRSAASQAAAASQKSAARPSSASRRARASLESGDGYYGESGAIMAPLPEKEGFFKNKKIIIFAAAGLAALLLLVFAARGMVSALGGGKKSSSARDNTLALVQKYLDKGQYDKAMDLLNGLLIANPNDADADKLLDFAIQQKKESDEKASAAQSVVVQPGDSSYNISIDTEEITAALREQNEKSQQIINDLLERQKQSQDEQKAEAAAEKKAAEELKKKEAAERKAAEEALAQKNAALKSKIKEINERINAGKADLNTGGLDGALRNFEFAVSQLPLQEGEPAFSAAKYSEIASSLYDAAASEKDPAKKERLKNAAITYVNKSLSVNPADPVSHYILGMNYGEASPPDWPRAEKELQEAVKNAGDNYIYWYQLGRAQFRLKKYSEARKSFEAAVKYNPNFDAAHFNLGTTLKRLSLNKEALSSFRKARQANPQNSKACLEEARLLNDAFKDSAGALACYQKVMSLDPANTAAMNECGVVYSNMGKYKEAEECHRKAVARLAPGQQDPITYYNLATALFNQKKYEDAQKYAKLSYEQKDAIKSAKERAVVVYNYALIEDSMGDADKAIALYREVLSLDSSNSKTKTNLGVMFMNMGDANTALSFFLDAYKSEKSFELENNLGSAYLAKKDFANATTHFQNALKKNSKDQTVRFNLAQAYSGAGDFDNAKTIYLEIINANPQNYDAYIEVSKVFVALKDTKSARDYLNILRQKNPAYKKSEVDALLAATAN